MFDELEIYINHGHFFFERGQTLSQVCNAPQKPGVYYILQLMKGHVDLVYIGMAGTIEQEGSFSEQLLYGRLNNKQDGVKRQQFFEDVIQKKEIDALDIYWYVTFDSEHRDLPAYVEALLLQRYFGSHGCLPEWNKSF